MREEGPKCLLPREDSRRAHCNQSLPDSRVQAPVLTTTSFLNGSRGGSSSLPFDYLRAILREPGRIKQSYCGHYYGPSLGLNESLENRPFYSVCLSLNGSPALKAWTNCAYLHFVMSQPVYHFWGPGIGNADGLAEAMAPPTNLSCSLRPEEAPTLEFLKKALSVHSSGCEVSVGTTGVFISCVCMDLNLGTGSVRDIFSE